MHPQPTPTQLTILKHLSDGTCHSGNELGEALGITRTAIWKHINQLNALGINIQSIPHKGYQLENPLTLLDAEEISQSLIQASLKDSINIHTTPIVDSTNQYLKSLPPSNTIDICCTEMQTQGRGRLGRIWTSPFGENIYCSIRWNYTENLSQLSGLSLIISLAIVATLKQLTPSEAYKIKWPNDVYWHDQKISGNLIEMQIESNTNAMIIIGIGLNINSHPKSNLAKDRPWTSLTQITNKHWNRNQILPELIKNTLKYLNQFKQKGFESFMEEWMELDYLHGKSTTVQHAGKELRGIARGINSQGLLILEDANGAEILVSCGDAGLGVNNTG